MAAMAPLSAPIDDFVEDDSEGLEQPRPPQRANAHNQHGHQQQPRFSNAVAAAAAATSTASQGTKGPPTRCYGSFRLFTLVLYYGPVRQSEVLCT